MKDGAQLLWESDPGLPEFAAAYGCSARRYHKPGDVADQERAVYCGAGRSASPGTSKRGTAPRHPVERRKRRLQEQRFQDQSSGSLQRGVRIFSPGVFQAGQKRRRIEVEAVDLAPARQG